MGNERLRAAMDRAGITIESVARDVEVDPKTVQRWLGGRIPHARHRWAVAERLDEHEEFFWPDSGNRPRYGRRPNGSGGLGLADR